MEFIKFKKIPRLSRDCIITEKINGSNAQICIVKFKDFWNLHEGYAGDSVQAFLDKYCIYSTLAIQDENDIKFIFAGSRNRWLDTSSKGDNYGFAKWVQEHAEELLELGEGRYFGEWYGKGIQVGYELNEKRFALFNVNKWHKYTDEKRLVSIDPQTKEERYTSPAPKCCEVVPILWQGEFHSRHIERCLNELKLNGSYIVPGFMDAEGIVIYHSASGQLFKKTLQNDEKPKGVENVN